MVDGMQDFMKCAMCSEVYQAGAREPLVLPCGHTFCRTCLASLKMTGNLLCPTCRQPHNNVQVDRLSVNHSLLSMSNLKYETCSEHGDDLKYWCCGCDLLLCSLCLYSGHPQGHNIQLAKAYVQEKKVALESQVELLDKQIEHQQKDVRGSFVELVWGVNEMLQENSTLHNIQLDVVKLLENIGKVSSIKGIMIAEQSLREYRSKVQELVSLDHHRKADEKSLAKDKTTMKNKASEADAQDVQQTTDKACAVLPSQSAFELLASRYTTEKVKEDGKVPHFALDCRDGRLLLHSLPRSTKSSLSQQEQLSIDVFLELSVDGRFLGRVYIRLCGHLRRAQQFLALCLGTLGSSYIGVKAAEISNKCSFGENIVFNTEDFITSSSVKSIFTNLEFGGDYNEELREGLLLALPLESIKNVHSSYFGGIVSKPKIGAATFGGPVAQNQQITTPSTSNGSFCICTRDASTVNILGTAFGKVVSGLEVVKMAVTQDPATEVTISQCGLVLPHLTL